MITTYLSLLALILLIFITTIAVFQNLWRHASKLRNYAINFAISTFTILVLLLILEVSFYTVMVRSDSFSFTLANQRWFEIYWHPINQLGYRDVDYPEDTLKSHPLMMVVGDSFIAGQGIKNYQDRLSNRLQTKLGQDWIVLNIAQVGWSTTEEYQAIISYPEPPAVIILAYFIDDIRAAANRSKVPDKFSFTELVQPPPNNLFGWLIKHSYLANFYYWEWYRYHNRQPEDIYWQRLRYFYGDGEAWQVHQQELRTLVNYTRQHNIKLLPIIFPNLISLELSRPIIDKVSTLFQTLGVPALDLSPYFQHHSPAELVVNKTDAHPNEQVNAAVAEMVFAEITKRHLIEYAKGF